MFVVNIGLKLAPSEWFTWGASVFFVLVFAVISNFDNIFSSYGHYYSALYVQSLVMMAQNTFSDRIYIEKARILICLA